MVQPNSFTDTGLMNEADVQRRGDELAEKQLLSVGDILVKRLNPSFVHVVALESVGMVASQNILVVRPGAEIDPDYNFVTSDNPVVLMDIDSHDVTPFRNGLANSKTLIYYPISPKLLLGAYHPDLYFGALGQMDGCIEILDGNKEKQFIHTQNKKQREQSNYIYAQSKETLETLL